ncbi:MAG: hypothetical protein QM756_14120 [Polyangiaceae bacterium]
MHQSWIFGSMLTAGMGLFSTAAWIEADRAALTGRDARADDAALRTTISSLKDDHAAKVEVEDSTLMLPQIEITARRPPQRPRAQRVVRAEPPIATEPCSRWQELGPAIVDDGNPIGVRRVRSLCLGPLAIVP